MIARIAFSSSTAKVSRGGAECTEDVGYTDEVRLVGAGFKRALRMVAPAVREPLIPIKIPNACFSFDSAGYGASWPFRSGR